MLNLYVTEQWSLLCMTSIVKGSAESLVVYRN